MKKSNFLTKHSGLLGTAALALVTVFGISSCRPDYNLDTEFPEWLGTSIYETLKEGFDAKTVDDVEQHFNFTYFVKLIEDLGQDAILAKTGTRTMFVADDEAFERFFQNNSFTKADGSPVRSYEDLSTAQKNMILMGSTLNNVYQVAMLSNTTGDNGPIIGTSMRKLSSSTIYDTVPVIPSDKLPAGKEWDRFRAENGGHGITIMQNGTVKPMIFFVNKFLTAHKITDDDYDFLFNQGAYGTKPARKAQDATVNGIRIKVQNKKCFNGFIHVMDDVVYLLPNMAEYLQTSNKAVIYSRIVERFGAPYYFSSSSSQDNTPNSRAITDNVQQLVDNGDLQIPRPDTVFTKMYLSKHTYGGNTILYQPSNRNVSFDQNQVLKFDPGWNTYYTVQGSVEADNAMQQNMAVMLVPLDSVIAKWWLVEGGKELRSRYGLQKYAGRTDLTYAEVAEDMDSVDLDVILELVNNNMLLSLTNSVPSKFGNVLNDAQDPMFENPRDAVATMDSVVICCNGAIYFTTAVYSPTAYRSVSYPTLVNEKLQVLKWAVKNDNMSFSAYLNSMVSTYSFFTPIQIDTTDANLNNKLIWVDPVSFGYKPYGDTDDEKSLTAMVFSYNEKKTPKVQADIYKYDPATGTVYGSPVGTTITSTDIIEDRLLDLLDYHIIIGDVEKPAFTDAEGYSYFQTKGRGTVRFKSATDPTNFTAMDVQGGWQLETGEKINILDRIDLSKGSTSNGNGRTYIIDKPLQTSRKSVFDVLSDATLYPEFSSFFNLMNSPDVNLFKGESNDHAIGSRNCVSSFNTYHYTVYVPTNASLDALLSTGLLRPSGYGDSIVNYYSDLKAYLEDNIAVLEDAQSQFCDSIKAFRIELDNDGILAKLPSTVTFDESDPLNFIKLYAEYEKNKTSNFVKYHIQDNSVYADAEFNAGYDEHGNPATEAKFETAYMDSAQQFVKLTVKGGHDITLTDKKGNDRHVLKNTSTSGRPLYNIMCREYEYDQKANALADESSVGTVQIETSSYVVIHQIDGPLCNGEVEF